MAVKSQDDPQEIDLLRASLNEARQANITLLGILHCFPAIEHQQRDALLAIEFKHAPHPPPDPTLKQILAAIEAQTVILQQIADDLAAEPDHTITARISFGGNTMPSAPGVLAVGSTVQAVFEPVMADGTVNSTATVSTAPSWSSSDASVATVDANGLVTGVGAGTATITASQGSFTDSDGTVAGPFDASNTVSDTAPVQRTVSAQISFK